MLINLYEKYGDRLVYQKNGYEGKGRSRTPPPLTLYLNIL